MIVLGRTQERLARAQESYITASTTSWLESLERSLVQMKEYQASRKRLETRRLAYDTSLVKMQKAKKEDFRVEEELRTQKAKYEESADDVMRRMEEVRETDPDSVNDLGAFLDAELAYHDKCRDALLQLKNEWPSRYVHAGGATEKGLQDLTIVPDSLRPVVAIDQHLDPGRIQYGLILNMSSLWKKFHLRSSRDQPSSLLEAPLDGPSILYPTPPLAS